jgi:hypothetical protein
MFELRLTLSQILDFDYVEFRLGSRFREASSRSIFCNVECLCMFK